MWNDVEECFVLYSDVFPWGGPSATGLPAQMSECPKVITLGEAMAYVLSGMYGPVKALVFEVGTVGSHHFPNFHRVWHLVTGLGGWKCYPHHPPTVLRWSHCILTDNARCFHSPSTIEFSVIGLIPREFSSGVDLG